jgi:hypothetical protein
MRYAASICFTALLVCLSACSREDARNLVDKLTAKNDQNSGDRGDM